MNTCTENLHLTSESAKRSRRGGKPLHLNDYYTALFHSPSYVCYSFNRTPDSHISQRKEINNNETKKNQTTVAACGSKRHLRHGIQNHNYISLLPRPARTPTLNRNKQPSPSSTYSTWYFVNVDHTLILQLNVYHDS